MFVFLAISALAAAVAAPTGSVAEPAMLSADRAFVQAAAARDVKTVASVLDQDFTWTDADGATLDASHVRQALPKPAIADEARVRLTVCIVDQHVARAPRTLHYKVQHSVLVGG